MRYLANIERFAVDECRLAHDIVSLQQLLPFLLHIVGRHFINIVIDEVHQQHCPFVFVEHRRIVVFNQQHRNRRICRRHRFADRFQERHLLGRKLLQRSCRMRSCIVDPILPCDTFAGCFAVVHHTKIRCKIYSRSKTDT